MRNLLIKLFKQRKTNKTWGYFLQTISQLGMIAQLINMSLLIITTATVLQTRGIMIPVWLLGLVACSVILSAALVIFKMGVPSWFSAWNDQFYKHENPLRQDLENIKESLARLEKANKEKERDTVTSFRL